MIKNIEQINNIKVIRTFNKHGELKTVNINNEFEVHIDKCDEYGQKANKNYLTIFKLENGYITQTSKTKTIDIFNGNNIYIDTAVDTLIDLILD